MALRPIPELLAPAGSLDAVRAALANGADSIYLGASRFNARDEGAQLSLEEVAESCRLAHARGRRIYLTLNVLIKPAELRDALLLLGECVDAGIDAVIVQDLGLLSLIRQLYPALELHGSTQMTVHDAAGAALLRELGVARVVLARENTLEDIRAIHAAVPGLGLESFVHGALCISYSGQCFMSGMISERSANRGSCAQSCRKDYVLTDADSGSELDRGYLISAKDLGAYEHLAEIADAGVVCLKVEGRKKRPEYVATVSKSYREFLDRLECGDTSTPTSSDLQPLTQIYSRGFTGGMYGGRVGKDYVTRSQPDNRGVEIGVVVGTERGEIVVDVSSPLRLGDGLGFEPPGHLGGPVMGCSVDGVRTIPNDGLLRQAIAARIRVAAGWRVIRTSEAGFLERARATYASLATTAKARKRALDVRLFGSHGSPLKALFSADGETVTLRSRIELVPATKRALEQATFREQFSRLGDTPFILGNIDDSGLGACLFLPVSELNHLRQQAVDELLLRRDWATSARLAERADLVHAAISNVRAVAPPKTAPTAGPPTPLFSLAVQVYRVEDAEAAAASGATEICFDPFVRHPAPPIARLRALHDALRAQGISLRLRTPTIVRPADRRAIQQWLGLGLPVLSGHIGLVAELSRAGIDVVADYAANVMNQHTAAELFRVGAHRMVLSIELTADEMAAVSAPWSGVGFDVFLYGRPEGMTMEHCILSAAFDREPTTCRDLCVQKHPNVELTDPTGYAFPVATDSACRNRLLHSRPLDGSEFLPRLWSAGLRNFHVVFNTAGDPLRQLVAGYRALLDSLAEGCSPPDGSVRSLLDGQFTRGHFARAV